MKGLFWLAALLPTAAFALPLPPAQAGGFVNLSGSNLLLDTFGELAFDDASIGHAALAIDGGPVPRVAVEARLVPPPIDGFTIIGGAGGTLSYSVEILGDDASLPVQASFLGGAQGRAEGLGQMGFVVGWTLLGPTGALLGQEEIFTGGLTNQNFSRSLSTTLDLTLQTNRVYTVILTARADVSIQDRGSFVAASAFMDPFFAFGAGVDPSRFSFAFSDGIGNAVPVPEPAPWLLLATGVLGLAARRRAASVSTTAA